MLKTIINNDDVIRHLSTITSDSLYIFDLEERRYIFINGQTSKLSGFTQAEVSNLGNKIFDFVHPEDRQRMLDHYDLFKTASDEEVLETECRLQKKDGGYTSVLTREKVYKRNELGEAVQIIGLAQSTSKSKESEAKLKTVTETFISAFKFSGIGMALVSLDGKWMDVNEAVCRITGYTKEDLLRLTFQEITHPDDIAVDMRYISQMLNREIDTYNLEKRYIRKDGQIVWVMLTVSLVWNQDWPTFFIAQINDITQQKALEQTLSIRNSELEATRDSLISKIEKLEELNYLIAHNLRGPANNFKLLADALIAKESNTDDPNGIGDNFTITEIASLMGEGATSLINSLNHLMELATINLNRNINFDLCDVEGICNEITTQLSGTVHEKQAEIDYHFDVKTISCPRPYFESILYNLLSNALKYSAKDKQPKIKVSTTSEGNVVLLSVKDNGIGLDLERYGKKMFKLNQVFHSGYDSKGVGLFLTKAQIESIGGTITVKSKVGEGTEFVVRLKANANSK